MPLHHCPVRAAFGLDHPAQLVDAPIERDALRVDFGAEDLAVVLDAELEADEAAVRIRARGTISRSAFVTRQSTRSPALRGA